MKIIPRYQNDNIKRVNEIYQVLKDYDFGYLIEENTFFKKFPLLKTRKEVKTPKDTPSSVRIRKVMEELGPAYIKLGQLMSTRPDLVGLKLAKELEKLRDDTPAVPFEEIKEVIEKELGKPIDEIYKTIDTKPIGSASIGQVYKAKLLNGDDVALKVQKPHIHRLIESDLTIMEFLTDKINRYIHQTQIYNLPELVSEFKRSIMQEIDYEHEVRNMEILSYNFKNSSHIHIPTVYKEYCSKKVITMELIKGIEVSELFESENKNYDKKIIAKRGVNSYFKQVLLDGFYHADPHSGNIFILENNTVCYIDMGMMGTLTDKFKEELAELLMMLLGGNSENILNQLVYMEIITREQKTKELEEDVADLINQYYGAELENMNGLIEKLLHIMIQHNVKFPREFALIGRGISLIEDIGKKLDPNFNASKELKKLSKRILLHKYEPQRLMSLTSNYMLELEHLTKNLPDRINNTLHKFEQGEIEIKLVHEEIDNMTNRLSISLILSALIIGSSLTIVSDSGPKLFDIPVLGLIGFLFSGILGGYLVIKLIHKSD